MIIELGFDSIWINSTLKSPLDYYSGPMRSPMMPLMTTIDLVYCSHPIHYRFGPDHRHLHPTTVDKVAVVVDCDVDDVDDKYYHHHHHHHDHYYYHY